MKLTPAQITVLKMIRGGVVFQLRGDGLKGRGVFHGYRYSYRNCPSLPPLYRHGMIEMTVERVTTKSLYYSVKLTQQGKDQL